MADQPPPRPSYTAFLIESAWIAPSIAIPVTMFVVLVLTAFVVNVRLPGPGGHIDPTKVDQTPPFSHPGVTQVGPDHYSAVITAQTWLWRPNEIRVPVGSTVDFIIASKDVTHSFLVDDTDINLMVVPGYISRATYRFSHAGEYRLLCNEYCGIGHQTMGGRIIVEGP